MIYTVVAMVALLAVLLCWNLIEVHRSRTTRFLLYFAIPLVLCFPFVTYGIIQSQLGYPTRDVGDLAESEWVLVSAAVTQETIFATVWFPGEDEPRLYAVEANEQNRRAFGEANGQAQEGRMMKGRMGTHNDGEFEFHEFTLQEQMPKDAPRQSN